MHILRLITIPLLLLLGACADRESEASLRPFGASDMPSTAEIRTPFTAPLLVVRHSQGFSTVSVRTRQDVGAQYATGGTGASVPMTVFVEMPDSIRGLVRGVHRYVELDRTFQFDGLLTDEANRASALALAKQTLQRSYCRGGVVTENTQAVVFDNSGTRPVARPVPVIRANPFGGRFVPGWRAELRCSLWRKV